MNVTGQSNDQTEAYDRLPEISNHSSIKVKGNNASPLSANNSRLSQEIPYSYMNSPEQTKKHNQNRLLDHVKSANANNFRDSTRRS